MNLNLFEFYLKFMTVMYFILFEFMIKYLVFKELCKYPLVPVDTHRYEQKIS